MTGSKILSILLSRLASYTNLTDLCAHEVDLVRGRAVSAMTRLG